MVTVKPFGKIADGTEVDLISIQNDKGSILEVTNYGACVTSIKIKMADDSLRDVVLGYDTPAEYEDDKGNYFGATIGRIANRILFVIHTEKFDLMSKAFQMLGKIQHIVFASTTGIEKFIYHQNFQSNGILSLTIVV